MIVIDSENKVAVNFERFSKIFVSALQGRPALKIIADDNTLVYEAPKEVCEKLFDLIIDAYVSGYSGIFDIRKTEVKICESETE